MNRKAVFSALLCVLLPVFVSAQAAELVSAEKYFDTLSASFGKVSDYIADIGIVNGKATYHGRLSYKSPLYLRIDFDDPPKMVLNFDGEKLLWYSPQNAVVLEQDYKKTGREPARGHGEQSELFPLEEELFRRLPDRPGSGPAGGRLPGDGDQAEARFARLHELHRR